MHALHKFIIIHVLTCFRQNALGSEIIDGRKARENQLKYMASVQNNDGHMCGGALVTEDFVLTAAHCDDVNPIRVVLGVRNLKRPHKIVRGIIKKCKHPSYLDDGYQHDLMLLKLSRKVRPGTRVKLIRLPSSEMTLKENEKCHVAGWGFIKSFDDVVNKLRMVDVSVVSQEVCEKQWEVRLPSVICAGGYNTTKGFCDGDSGGPLVCNRTAVGVVSFGEAHCDFPSLPNVYADVSKDLTWINKILKQKDC